MRPEDQQVSEPVQTSITEDQVAPGSMGQVAMEPTQMASGAQSLGPKVKNKKVGLVAGIIAAVVLLGGSASAYQFWYQNPDKVMVDAVSHLMTEKYAKTNGTITIDSEYVKIAVELAVNNKNTEGSMNADLTITPKTEELTGFGDIKVGADAIVSTEGDVYFRAREVEKVYNQIIDSVMERQQDRYSSMGYEVDPDEMEAQREQIDDIIHPILDQIDDKWIKVSADDLSRGQGEEEKCTIDLLKKIQTDDAMTKELVSVYKSNKFVVVNEELGVKDGNIGYRLGVDREAAKSFGMAVKDIELGREIIKCDEDAFDEAEETTSDAKDDIEGTFDIWINRWSHKLARVEASMKDKDDEYSFTTQLDFAMGASDDVVIPSDATDFKEIQDTIENLVSGAMSATNISI